MRSDWSAIFNCLKTSNVVEIVSGFTIQIFSNLLTRFSRKINFTIKKVKKNYQKTKKKFKIFYRKKNLAKIFPENKITEQKKNYKNKQIFQKEIQFTKKIFKKKSSPK